MILFSVCFYDFNNICSSIHAFHSDIALQSIRTHGWLPDLFRQIIRGAKDFLQEVIFKFKLLQRPMPEYSTRLIYDANNERWILTDGLGNGWIR